MGDFIPLALFGFFLPGRLGHAFCLRGGPKITSYKSRLSSNSTYGGGEISSVTHLGGGFKCFLILTGEMIQFDRCILLQMGW